MCLRSLMSYPRRHLRQFRQPQKHQLRHHRLLPAPLSLRLPNSWPETLSQGTMTAGPHLRPWFNQKKPPRPFLRVPLLVPLLVLLATYKQHLLRSSNRLLAFLVNCPRSRLSLHHPSHSRLIPCRHLLFQQHLRKRALLSLHLGRRQCLVEHSRVHSHRWLQHRLNRPLLLVVALLARSRAVVAALRRSHQEEISRSVIFSVLPEITSHRELSNLKLHPRNQPSRHRHLLSRPLRPPHPLKSRASHHLRRQ